MSAEQILNEMLDGQEQQRKARPPANPRELLKGLPPVSASGRHDYNISIEIGYRRGTKFELKYPSWGAYPSHELRELITLIRIDYVKQLAAAYEREHTRADIASALNVPTAQIEQNKKRAAAMADFFKGPLA